MSLFVGMLVGSALGLSVLWLVDLLITPDEMDPASHAVAHAEGWPCSCPGRQR